MLEITAAVSGAAGVVSTTRLTCGAGLEFGMLIVAGGAGSRPGRERCWRSRRRLRDTESVGVGAVGFGRRSRRLRRRGRSCSGRHDDRSGRGRGRRERNRGRAGVGFAPAAGRGGVAGDRASAPVDGDRRGSDRLQRQHHRRAGDRCRRGRRGGGHRGRDPGRHRHASWVQARRHPQTVPRTTLSIWAAGTTNVAPDFWLLIANPVRPVVGQERPANRPALVEVHDRRTGRRLGAEGRGIRRELLRAGLAGPRTSQEEHRKQPARSPGSCARARHGVDPFAWHPDRTQSLGV